MMSAHSSHRHLRSSVYSRSDIPGVLPTRLPWAYGMRRWLQRSWCLCTSAKSSSQYSMECSWIGLWANVASSYNALPGPEQGWQTLQRELSGEMPVLGCDFRRFFERWGARQYAHDELHL